MREIKFRAKTTVKEDKSHAFNNVWVEGDLIVSNGRYYIHPRANKVNVDNDLGKFIVMHEVQKDTVCEYTGLKDKNGKEIYEGDIVQILLDKSLWIISFANEYWYSYVIEDVETEEVMHLYEYDYDDYEVIGNKFDNPELMKGGAE